MQQKIVGTTMPVLEFVLDPGDRLVDEAGELGWIGSSIELPTSTSAGGGGGVFGAFKRAIGGGSLFMTEYRAVGAPGLVAFATKVPGHILPIDVRPERPYLVHRHGFLCATPGLELSVGFQRSLGAGVFGGQGFILPKTGGKSQAAILPDGALWTSYLTAAAPLPP